MDPAVDGTAEARITCLLLLAKTSDVQLLFHNGGTTFLLGF